MIARTRPYVNLKQTFIFLREYKKEHPKVASNVFFLNSGQACLEVFLRSFHKKMRVGVQVFTCPTVVSAIERAGCTPVFMDVSKEYFTSSFEDVKFVIDKIDILLLTHVFGIPNPEYCQIKKICEEKNVILLDDLCQTFHAKIQGIYLEELSDNYFYSFFYDKPISCTSGGMLKVSTRHWERVAELVNQYSKESDREGKCKINRLINVQNLLSPDIYKKDFRTGNVLETFILSMNPSIFNYKLLYTLLSSPINKVARRVLPRHSYSNSIKRLSDLQIAYILLLFENYKDRTSQLVDYYVSNKISVPKYLTNASINCSCSQRAIVMKDDICLINAEINLYNWPELLDKKNRYQNAEYVIKNFVNIPII